MAVGIADVEPLAMSAVYCYFDPALEQRSLGVFNVLSLLTLCRQRGQPHLYLGYYVAGSPRMSYKAGFRPCEQLGRGWPLGPGACLDSAPHPPSGGRPTHGRRLDEWAQEWLGEALGRAVSRSEVRRWIMAGAVRMEGAPLRRPGLPVATGRHFEAALRTEQHPRLRPPADSLADRGHPLRGRLARGREQATRHSHPRDRGSAAAPPRGPPDRAPFRSRTPEGLETRFVWASTSGWIATRPA